MTTLQKLEQLFAAIDIIAKYEIGNPEVRIETYASHLRIAVQLAEDFDMNFYAAQCREKLEGPVPDR